MNDTYTQQDTKELLEKELTKLEERLEERLATKPELSDGLQNLETTLYTALG
eukprot:SAG31_NODE_16276_length_715_cov_2.225649_1_plen_51_part_10